LQKIESNGSASVPQSWPAKGAVKFLAPALPLATRSGIGCAVIRALRIFGATALGKFIQSWNNNSDCAYFSALGLLDMYSMFDGDQKNNESDTKSPRPDKQTSKSEKEGAR
jgi:hypothetical protein